MADAPSVLPPPPPPFLPPDEIIRKNLDSRQVRIQLALFITFSIFTTILVLGRLRSQGNSTMKLFSTYLFITTAYLVSFIPGLMSASGESNDLYIFWVAFIAYLAAVTNEISCYTLGDNEDRKKRLMIDYFVVWPLILTSLYKSLASPDIIVPIVIIFWIVVLKLRERSRALLYATKSSNGLSRSTKIISDYNKYQKDSGQVDTKYMVGVIEAVQMVAKQPRRGSRIIDFDPLISSVITLDTIIDEQNETLLTNSSTGNELKETCFSFAMFWVLLAKIAGYKNINTTIFRGPKLPDNSFALIEKELDFLYDYLFTNYYAIYNRGMWKKFRDLCVISVFFWLTIPLLVEYRAEKKNLLYVVLWRRVLDNGFTRFVILAIIAIEFTQIGIFLTSKWAKVMYTCSYIGNKTPWGTTRSKKSKLLQLVIRIVCLIPRPRLSLSTTRKISQYTVLDCHYAIPKSVWLKCWIGSYFDLPRVGQAGDSNINVPSEVQQSILDAINTSLASRQSKFTNGVYYLKKNEVADEIITEYIRKQPNEARVILIWHIATSLLENDERRKSDKSVCKTSDFVAATTMSKYCAYLVAFFPKMLTDHVYTTICEFDDVVEELEEKLLRGEYDDEDPKGGLTGDNSTYEEGRKLKKYLELPNLWETLAQFWTEKLIYLALSDHGEAIDTHADSLCIGGQFITHVWALLTHAGCSKAPISTLND